MVSTAGCGDATLANVGDLSGDFVHGSTSTTSTTLIDDGAVNRPVDVIESVGLVWENDAIPDQATETDPS